MAIIALVAAVAGLFLPVLVTVTALVLALAAARAIRRSGGTLTGKGLAYTAAVTACVVLVVNAFTIAGLVRAWPQISDGMDEAGDVFGVVRGVMEGRLADASGLAAGDCYLQPLADDYSVVERVDCATPHDGQVVAAVPLGHQDYPGAPALEEEIATACEARFDEAGLPEGDDAELRAVAPDLSRWGAGVRSGLCVIVPASPGGKLTGSRLSG